MRSVWSVAQVVAAEHATGEALASGALMQRAASGLASVLLSELPRPRRARRVLLVVGTGNNGGDALWAGVRLLARGVRVWAWRAGATVHAEGWQAFTRAGGREADAVAALALLSDADLVVDGVLGLGGRGGLREPAATFARACADAGVRVVAVDLPSGLDADAGVAAASFAAGLTVTFGGLKTCHVAEPAASRCGEVRVVDIGLDLPAQGAPTLLAWEPADVAAHWPVPDATSDKYARGVVGLDTGSAAYPGAGVLSASGAVYAGAGMVRHLGDARAAVVAALPDVVTAPGRVQAHLLGCGWGERADAAATVARVLAEGLPVVLDADAVRQALPDGAPPAGRADGVRPGLLLTPHAGELAALLQVARADVEADPVAHARRAARLTGGVVLLKGATQYVAEPDGQVTLAVPGPAWTARAGSGDTLAGIAVALLAAGLPPREAALAAASAQALTAAAHPGPRPPQDLIRLLPDVVAALVGSARP